MRTHFDRETFQQLLANAFAVQQSQIDRQSLSEIMEIQRLIASRNLDLDSAMNRVVESARKVANASGVAIGLLDGDQLTYCTAAGTSVSSIGQHVTASLTVSPATGTSREILRVEDANTDTRIGASICRQFGVNSLLILPICLNGAVAGVLDIRFSDAHTFEELEVRTYRLLAEQVETAIAVLPEPGPTESTEPQGESSDEPYFWMGESSVPSFFERSRSALAAAKDSPAFRRSTAFATTMVRHLKHWIVPTHLFTRRLDRPSLAQRWTTELAKARKRLAFHQSTFTTPQRLRTLALVSAALLLAFTSWFTYRRHRSIVPLESSTLPKSTDVDPPAALVKPLAGKSVAQPELTPVKEPRRSTTAPRHGQVGDRDVYDIGDDVTVRLLAPRPAVQRSVQKGRITHFGDDVTVHYFTPNQPAARPVSR